VYVPCNVHDNKSDLKLNLNVHVKQHFFSYEERHLVLPSAMLDV